MTVHLIVSDETLLGAGHEPATVLDHTGAGHGTIPAQVARTLIAAGLDINAAWLQKLYTDPGGDLIAATSTRRFYADGLATWLRVRDQGLCRTPYCDAPIRHLDHITPAHLGGATTLDNGQGLCAACNQAKEAAGWTTTPIPGESTASGRHEVVTRTPTGDHYRSTAPPPPRPVPSTSQLAERVGVVTFSWVEHALDELLKSALGARVTGSRLSAQHRVAHPAQPSTSKRSP